MCNFLSVLVMRNGDVKHHPMLDSHSELVTYFAIPDTRAHHQHFAKAELTPGDGDWLDASTWTWRIDEPTRPGWLDDVEVQAEKKARHIASRMILKEGERPFILDGCWILGGAVVVGEMRGGRIVSLREGGTVQDIRGGTVQAIWGGTVRAISGGTVQDIRGGTVQAIWGGTVRAISGGTVQAIWGGTVQAIDGGTVQAIWGGTVQAIDKLRLKSGYIVLTDQSKAALMSRGLLDAPKTRAVVKKRKATPVRARGRGLQGG